jgi:hypothetical protein
MGCQEAEGTARPESKHQVEGKWPETSKGKKWDRSLRGGATSEVAASGVEISRGKEAGSQGRGP